MAFTRRPVRLPGQVVGNGHVADCVVVATEVSMGGTSVLTRIDIESTSKTLPQGNYQLGFNGMIAMMKLKNGSWAGGLADRTKTGGSTLTPGFALAS